MDKKWIEKFYGEYELSTKYSCQDLEEKSYGTNYDDEMTSVEPFRKLIQYLIDNQMVKSDFTLVDLGCGRGDYLKELATIFSNSTWVGIDSHPLIESPPDNLVAIKSDLMYILQRDCVGDIVLCRNIWHGGGGGQDTLHFINDNKVVYKQMEKLILTKYKFFITTLTKKQFDIYKTKSLYNDNLQTRCISFDDGLHGIVSLNLETE